MPLSGLDNEEINTILNIIGNFKNIGAGKSELVLSKIFWILCKLIKDNDEYDGKKFRIKFSERAINEAMRILINNQMRELDDPDEEQEKLILNLSCLHFLKCASASPESKKYLINKHE